MTTDPSTWPRASRGTPSQYLLGRYLRRLDARIAVSAEAERTMRQLHGGHADIIPNGISAHTYLQRPGPYTGHSTLNLVVLGRVNEPRKGVDVALAAVALAAQSIPDLHLHVIGQGQLPVPAALTGKVTWYGTVSEASKRQLLSNSHIYLAPHLGLESFGIVLAEAMASSVPVIASKIDAFADLSRAHNAAKLTPPRNARALADAIIDLATHPQEQERLAAAGLRTALEVDWSVLVPRIEAVYYSVYGARNGRSRGAGRHGTRLNWAASRG